MQGLMTGRNRWCSSASFWATVAAFFVGTTAYAVPIDLTNATPSVTGATTLHIDGIATLGASYWADFKWNDRTNKFDVSAYGEEEARGIENAFSADFSTPSNPLFIEGEVDLLVGTVSVWFSPADTLSNAIAPQWVAT